MTYTAVAAGGFHSLLLRSAPAAAAPVPLLAATGIDTSATLTLGFMLLLLGAVVAATAVRRRRA